METKSDKTAALLRDLGADEGVIETVTSRIDGAEVQGVVSKLRAFAEENPRLILGILSALVAGGAVAAGRAVVKKKNSRSKSKSAKGRSTTKKRTLIEPHPGDKRYIRRDAKGRIKESVDVGRSLSADSRHQSKTQAKPGQGDKGDR